MRTFFRWLFRLILAVVGIVVAFAAFVYFSLQAGDIPEDRFTPAVASIPVTDEPPVLIFGATRNTGLEVAKILKDRGERVAAFVRPESNTAALEALDAELYRGDGMDLATVEQAFEDGDFRAVVTTIGCLRCEPSPDFQANKNVIDAALAAGVERILLVTTIGSGDSEKSPPILSRWVLGKILPLKTQAENHLRATDADYTIVRPGGLGMGPATGTGILSEDPATFGFIDREELAQLIVGCLDETSCSRKTLSAIDAAKKTPW